MSKQTASADGEELTRAPAYTSTNRAMRSLAAVLAGLARALRGPFPPILEERRCKNPDYRGGVCRKLLCRAESEACLEVKCPRCGHMNDFP